MDPYESPIKVPYSSPNNPVLHSLLRTREPEAALVSGGDEDLKSSHRPRAWSRNLLLLIISTLSITLRTPKLWELIVYSLGLRV